MPASRRKKELDQAVSEDMAGRTLPWKEPTEGPQEAHGEPTSGLQKAHKGPTLHPVRIRIPEADWRTLEALADQEGTTPSALIRKAIKELLRRQGAGLR